MSYTVKAIVARDERVEMALMLAAAMLPSDALDEVMAGAAEAGDVVLAMEEFDTLAGAIARGDGYLVERANHVPPDGRTKGILVTLGVTSEDGSVVHSWNDQLG